MSEEEGRGLYDGGEAGTVYDGGECAGNDGEQGK